MCTLVILAVLNVGQSASSDNDLPPRSPLRSDNPKQPPGKNSWYDATTSHHPLFTREIPRLLSRCCLHAPPRGRSYPLPQHAIILKTTPPAKRLAEVRSGQVRFPTDAAQLLLPVCTAARLRTPRRSGKTPRPRPAQIPIVTKHAKKKKKKQEEFFSSPKHHHSISPTPSTYIQYIHTSATQSTKHNASDPGPHALFPRLARPPCPKFCCAASKPPPPDVPRTTVLLFLGAFCWK